MIRRNPGTSWTIISLVVAFGLGVILAYADWVPEVERTIVQCWALVATWVMTHYQIKWIEKLMKRQRERDRLNKSSYR